MGFYDDMQDVASEVLAEFKQGTVVLSRTTYAASDPQTPWIPGAPTPATYTLAATVSGVSAELVDGTVILATDLQIVCAVPAITPAPTDTVTIDGKAVSLLRVDQIPAAGAPVAFRLIVRG
jgi:hypothetical protein